MRLCLAFVTFFGLAHAALQSVAADGYLVQGGQPLLPIFVPRELEQASAFAIVELQEHIKAMTGSKLEVVWREPLGRESGIVMKVLPKGEWPAGASAQFSRVKQSLKPDRVTIEGHSHIGLLYGIYGYLESLGVHWFTPGTVGTQIPRLTDIAIEPGTTTYDPIYRLRSLDLSGGIDSHFGDPENAEVMKRFHDYTLWLLRNRLHFRRTIHTARGSNRFAFNSPPYSGGHALRSVAGLGRYFSDKEPASFARNPERWPLLERDFVMVRTNSGPHQICFTNGDNIKDAIDNSVRKLREIEASGNELSELAAVSLALADCGGICRCAECLRVGGSDPNSLDRLVWDFMNKVARGVVAEVPWGKIMLYAPYYDLTQPPPDVKIEPNIVAVSCRSKSWDIDSGQGLDDPFPPKYREWVSNTAKAGGIQAVYDYFLMSWAPQPLDILDAFIEYRKLGYTYYHPEVMQRNEQSWPLLWALARSCWDESRTPREWFSYFCHEYYGSKNGDLVISLLEEMSANSRKIKRIVYGCTMNTSVMFPDEMIKRRRADLKSAIKDSHGLERQRIADFSNSIDIYFRLAELRRADLDALNYRTPEKIAKVRGLALEFLNFWESQQLARLFSYRITAVPQTILRRDFAALTPKADAKPYHDTEYVLKILFSDGEPPVKASDIFVLPEIWQLKLDPLGVGRSEEWQSLTLPDGPANGWQEISSWNFIESQGYGFDRMIDGDFWYRVSFKAPPLAEGARVWLRMGGLDDEGTIFLNGVEVAEQRSADGHAWNKAFSVDVTATIRRDGDNLLVVHGYDAEGGAGVWLPTVIYATP